MVGVISFPFGGSIYYKTETAYNDGGTSSEHRISDIVTDARIETGDVNTELRSISSPSIVDFSRTMTNPTLHVEWVYQPHANSLASHCIERTDCDLDSLSFEVGVNTCSSSSDAFYSLTGCKCTSFTISASQGENWTCSADFSVASCTTDSSASFTDPGAIGTDYATFNTAGSITWTNAGTYDGAYVTNSFSITVNNNISDYFDVGNIVKKAAIPGARDITGTCDISIDNGGKILWDDIIGGVDITSIVFNSGRTTGDYGTITLGSGRFDSGSIDVNTSGEGMISSVPFTFEEITLSTGT